MYDDEEASYAFTHPTNNVAKIACTAKEFSYTSRCYNTEPAVAVKNAVDAVQDCVHVSAELSLQAAAQKL
jgi:hypothetical protein